MKVLRSIFCCATIATAALAATAAAITSADEAPIKILMVSDTSLFGYGVKDPADRLPAKLKAPLAAEGLAVEIIESANYDTSKGGIAWLKTKAGRALLANPKRSVVLVGLGLFDCGAMTLEQTEANLDRLLATLAEKNIPVLLVATKPRIYCGADYNARYPTIFPELADRYGHLLYVDQAEPPRDERPEGAQFVTLAVGIEGLLPSVRTLLARLSKPSQ